MIYLIVLLVLLNVDVRANEILRIVTKFKSNSRRNLLLLIKVDLNFDGIRLQRLINPLFRSNLDKPCYMKITWSESFYFDKK